MPSAPNARFPARSATLLVAVLVALGPTACSPEDEVSRPGESGRSPTSAGPDPSGSPTSRDASDDGEAGSPGSSGSVQIAAEDRKRTVRGRAPAYVQIRSASLDAGADRLTMAVKLAGEMPERMPNQKSILRVTFMVSMKDGTRYTFEAQCLRTGWGTFAAGGSDPEYIPELALSERGLSLTIDPLYIGGLRPFEWLASVAWTEGDVNYAFDVVPAEGFASYP